MSLEIERATSADVTTITVRGEVDLYTSPDLRAAIMDAAPAAPGGLELDLGGVEYMDSSGVATLVEGFKRSRELGKTFALVTPSRAVMKVLELTRLDAIFEIRRTR
jgi:anti-sigma B factor antagonist